MFETSDAVFCSVKFDVGGVAREFGFRGVGKLPLAFPVFRNETR